MSLNIPVNELSPTIGMKAHPGLLFEKSSLANLISKLAAIFIQDGRQLY